MGQEIKFNILHAEDDEMQVALVKAAFEELSPDNQFFIACDGEEALKMLKHENGYGDLPDFDLVLLDLNMPKKDGFEVLTEIRGDKDIRDIPIVVLSGNKDFLKISKSYQLGANSYISKMEGIDSYKKIAAAIQTCWLASIPIPNRMDL